MPQAVTEPHKEQCIGYCDKANNMLTFDMFLCKGIYLLKVT